MTLREFVVGLGFSIDEEGLNRVNGAMSRVTETVQRGMDRINESAETINQFSQRLVDGVSRGMNAIRDRIANTPIAKGLSTAFKMGQSVAKAGVESIKIVFNGLKTVGRTLSMNPLVQSMKSGLNKARGAVSAGINKIKGAFDKLKGVVAKINANPLVKGISTAMKKGYQLAKAGVKKITGALKGMSGKFKEFGTKIGDSIKNTFSPTNIALAGAAIVGVGTAVKNVIKGFTELNRETYATDKALEIMGKTMEEIQADPNLLAEFNELKATTESIGLPPALPESVELLDSITKSVNKLKVTFDIFLKWVGYHLLKNLDKPLRDFKGLLDKVNTWLANNMSRITEMIAKGVSKVIKVVQNVFNFLVKIFNVVKKVLDKLPDGVKKIGIAFAALWFMLKKNPLIMILSIIGLLIDDFMTFLEGGESALGGLWQAIMDFIDGLGGIDGIIEKITSFATVAIGFVIGVVKDLIQWIKNMWKWLKESGTLEKLKNAFISIFKSAINIIKLVIETVMKFWKALQESGALDKIGKLIATVFTTAIQIISKVIEFVVKLWQKISESGALDKLFSIASKVFSFIIGTVQSVIGWFTDLWGKVSEGGGTFDKIIEVVSSLIGTVVDLVATVIDLALKFLQLEPVKELFKGIGKIIETAVKGAIQLVIDTIGVLKNIIDAIVKLVKGDFKGAFESAGKAITGIFQGVTNVLSSVKNLVGDIVSGIGKVVKSGIDTITGGGGSKTPGHADGGIFNKEHMANFAENDNMEAVVPLEGPHKQKGIGIAQKVNSILGINQDSKVMPMMKQAVSKIFEATAMMKDMELATQAYNDVTNNNVVNNTYNTTQPIQLTVQVQMPAGGKVSTQEARRFGNEVGKGIAPQLNGIMMDNRQGAFV